MEEVGSSVDDHWSTRAPSLSPSLTFNSEYAVSIVVVVVVVCFPLSSLSRVTPPNIWYVLKLPQEVIDYCHLSTLQLEAVVYACQQHETFLADGTRAGFLIGTVYNK